MSIEAGNAARREGRPDEARRCFEDAVGAAGGDLEILALALHGLAQLDSDAGNYVGAATRYRDALQRARQVDDPQLLAHLLRHCADADRELGRLDAADAGFEEALQILREEPSTNKLTLANTVRARALLEEKRNNADSARSLWREARALYEETGIDAGIKESKAALARL